MSADNVIPFPSGRRGFAADPPRRRRPVPLPRRDGRAAFVVRVDLDEAQPAIWRRLRLASDLTLPQVHDVLQVAMGWTDSHLHQFVMGPGAREWSTEPFLTTWDLGEGEDGLPEAGVRLDEVVATPGDRLHYQYDFGDDWWHTITLEGVEPWVAGSHEAECLDGARACPPEDVGGIGGYEEVLRVLADRPDPDGPDPDWAEHLRTWLPEAFEPAAFSVADTNERLASGPLPALDDWNPAVGELLARAGGSALSPAGVLVKRALTGPWELRDEQAEAATHRYAHLVATVGAGIRLTAAGYLPPRYVAALHQELRLDDGWWGGGHREDQTYPVLALRESATAVGLLRKSRGDLLPTRAGQHLAKDPRRMLAHLGSRLPLGRPHERDAGLLALLFEAAGTRRRDARAEASGIFTTLGWRVEGNLELALGEWARPTLTVLENLAPGDDDPGHRALVARALLRRA